MARRRRWRAHADWLEVVWASLDEASAELTGLAGGARRLIDIAAQRIERDAASLLPAVAEPRLVHRDLHLGNVLMQGDSVTAVIDFEMVREWDAAYDFVKINDNFGTTFPDPQTPSLAGYREVRVSSASLHAPWRVLVVLAAGAGGRLRRRHRPTRGGPAVAPCRATQARPG